MSEITRDAIEKRMDEIRNAIRVLEDQLNAASGALAECGYWLQELEKPSDPPATADGGLS